jgi:hypothetical protein
MLLRFGPLLSSRHGRSLRCASTCPEPRLDDVGLALVRTAAGGQISGEPLVRGLWTSTVQVNP